MQSESAVVSITFRPCSIACRWVSSGISFASGSIARVAVEHARDAVLRHQDRLGADLERAQRRRGVGREERVAGAGGEDDDAALLEVAHGAAADVRLGDLLHLDRRQHARVGAVPLERLLHRERVEDRARACPCSRRSRGPCPARRRPCRGRCCRRRSRSRARARPSARRRARARASSTVCASSPYSREPIRASPDELQQDALEARRLADCVPGVVEELDARAPSGTARPCRSNSSARYHVCSVSTDSP